MELKKNEVKEKNNSQERKFRLVVEEGKKLGVFENEYSSRTMGTSGREDAKEGEWEIYCLEKSGNC
jgi:hypothetical protein